MRLKLSQIGVLVFASFGAANSYATDGYFSAGYGVKSQGIGGVGIALPQDGLAAASNPAGTAFVGDRIDLGLSWFAPKRSTEIVGNAVPGADGSYDGNQTKNFYLPEFGYAKQLNSSTAVGVAVYGNGGMDTDYGKNPYGAFGGTGRGVLNLDLMFFV